MSAANLIDYNTGKISSDYLPTFITNDLAAPVIFKAEAPGTAGNPVIYVEGNAASSVGGSLSLVPGSRTGAAAPDAGLTIVAQPTGVQVYVGTNGQATNNLSVAGASGLSRVYDGVYNQPVNLVPITIGTATYPPQAGNTGEIFRSTTFTGPAQANNNITVPKTGWYVFQTEIRVGGGGVVIPNVPPASIADVPGAIEIYLSVGATLVPYSAQTIAGNTLYSQSVEVGDIATITQTSFNYLTAGTNYNAVVVGDPNSAWNLGPSGQIKMELISMNQ
jgi:hypothetical protein